MPHFSSLSKAFAPRETVALTWRDGAPESWCAPSSLALLPLHPPLPLPFASAELQLISLCPSGSGPVRERGAGLRAVSVVPAPTMAGPGRYTCLSILGTVHFPSGPPVSLTSTSRPPALGDHLPYRCLHPGLCAADAEAFFPPCPSLKLFSFTLLPPVLLFPVPFPVLHLCRVFSSLSFL